MLKRKSIFFSILILLTFLVGCSEEEGANPQDGLEAYLHAWESFEFSKMSTYMTAESLDLLSEQEWALHERMEGVYGDLGIDQINLTFEARDFEEEELNLEELEELIYPVEVSMNTIAGDVHYTIDVILKKMIGLEEETEEELEEWLVQWHPSHIFMGLESPTDRIKIATKYPERGRIFDRNGEYLAVNGQVYRAGFIPSKIENFDRATATFANLFHMKVERVRELANAYPNNPDWEAPILRFPIDDPRQDELYNIPGVMWTREDGRQYPYGKELAHLIGNIGPITAEELEEREGEGYSATSVIGKRGLESVLEERLRGQLGLSISVLDENGNTRNVVVSQDPVNGEDIRLTIDAELQRRLGEIMGEEIGVGLVMNPSTGEVLALASQPSYNSDFQYLGMTDPEASQYDDINILYERRFQNTYSPGSTFKAITAAIGIEEGVLDPKEKVRIQGRRWQPEDNRLWGNYHVTRVSEAVSQVDLETAMMRSDNIYFAQKALAIGGKAFEEWAEKLGFTEDFKFAFPLYVSSIANDGLDKPILLADSGYGQGEVMVNPIHLSAMYSMFVNGGDMIQPVLFTEEPLGQMWQEDLISEETAKTVLESLISVVENPSGTAYRQDPGHNRAMAGKTGTAELKQSFDDNSGRQLGWYLALDYEKKDLLVAMMLDNPEGGSRAVVDKVNELLSDY